MKIGLFWGVVALSYSCQLRGDDLSRGSLNNSSQPIRAHEIPIVSVATNQAANGETLVPRVDGILILGGASISELNREGVSGVKGVVVKGLDFLKDEKPKIIKAIAPYLGKPLKEGDLDRLQTTLILLCRSLDRPVVDVYYPEQQIIEGTLQIVVIEGKVGQVNVVNSGRKWFKDELVRNKIRLKSGDSISQKKLLEDLDTVNRNGMFREVNVALKQGEFKSDGSGTTDVDLKVKDRFPLRAYGGYDNGGVWALGEDRVFAGFNYGNVFGLDHQLNYQYTTDTDFRRLYSHSGSYVIPTFGSQALIFYGGYSDFKPNINTNFVQKGNSYQVSALYRVPLPRWCGIIQEVSVGFDLKSANATTEFGGVNVYTNRADVDQFNVGYHGRLADKIGFSDLNIMGYYSPGGLSSDNKDASFSPFHGDAKAQYMYARLEAQRGFKMPYGMLLLGKGAAQYADGNLIPSEQFGLGGSSTVRGYTERLLEGDQGVYGSAELHTRFLKFGDVNSKKDYPGEVYGDTIEFFGFFDYGYVQSHRLQTYDFFGSGKNSIYLISAGAGLNFRISHNLNVGITYGFPLKNIEDEVPNVVVPSYDQTKGRGRLHVIATLSF